MEMYKFSGGDFVVLFIVVVVFAAGVYTLLKFRKTKDF
jgi:heme/copper-type cytochrome/quinol oxidase subunit 2